MIETNNNRPTRSNCRLFAVTIAAILIFLDIFTAVLVYQTRSDVKSLHDQVTNIKGYPLIENHDEVYSSYKNDKRKINYRIKNRKVIQNQPIKLELPETFEYPRLKSEDFPYFKNPELLFSDGNNDSPQFGKEICTSAKPDFSLKNDTKIFYTMFKPANPQENPDIKAIHLANHQVFRMNDNNGNLGLNTTDFDLQKRKTVVFIHGFQAYSWQRSSMLQQFFKGVENQNLILVDWRVLSNRDKSYEPDDELRTNDLQINLVDEPKRRQKRAWYSGFMFNFGATQFTGYTSVFKNRHLVAKEITHLLEIIAKQVPASDIHLVGHSLGAHVAGEASYYFQKIFNKKIGRITGLDPANLCFEEADTEAVKKQLTKEKAEFVDIWHTNTNLARLGHAGIERPIGHVDFWVNGGKFQPICLEDEDFNNERGQAKYVENLVDGSGSPCSHQMSYDYFVDSLHRCNGVGYNKGFSAYKISTKKLYEYQNDGQTETEFEFDDDYSVLVRPKMSFWSGSDAFEEVEDGSGENILEDTDLSNYDFGKHDFYWKNSKNYFVKTGKKRNPNRVGAIEDQFWSGYCLEG